MDNEILAPNVLASGASSQVNVSLRDAAAGRAAALWTPSAPAPSAPERQPEQPMQQLPMHFSNSYTYDSRGQQEQARRDWQINGQRLSQSYVESRPTGDGGEAAMVPPRWVPNTEARSCTGCHKDFDWARRRHHCRCCGMIFCDTCSKNKALLPRIFGTRDPQRCCDPCHQRLIPLQDELISTNSNAVKANSIDSTDGSRMRPYLNNPVSMTLGAEIRKAAYSLSNFTRPGIISDKSIPTELLSKACGLAFLTVVKGGFIFAGRIGTGLVVAKLEDGRWSAPSAIATLGMSWGALIGGEITDFVLILNSPAAVDAFRSKRQVSMGAELGVAIGPLGRSGAGSVAVGGDLDYAPVYSYSHSKGLFAGISLEGAVVSTRSDVNRKFYGKDVDPKELLSGTIQPPPAGQPLYDAISVACPSVPVLPQAAYGGGQPSTMSQSNYA
jgi:lipid-binding SYLF domain-containing protein